MGAIVSEPRAVLPEETRYDAAAFWQGVLSAHPDLSGTGEPGLSLAYNRAMYRLREIVVTRELAKEGVKLLGARVLDGGSGVGFWVNYYLRRGASVTGIELTEAGATLLRRRFPQAHIVQGDLAETDPGGTFDVVNCCDVLYHITDDTRWEAALRRLARAVEPGGVLLVSDVVGGWRGPLAAHCRPREKARYQAILQSEGLTAPRATPTHWWLNRELGVLRGLNRVPALLYALDRLMLAVQWPVWEPGANQLLVSRRPRSGT
jgi:SAM-dependent methyltransferase